MKKSKRRVHIFAIMLLILAFIFSLYPVRALTPLETPRMLAWKKASLLREIIISDVPECTWRSDTICSNSFPLYDLDSNVNGYVFEF